MALIQANFMSRSLLRTVPIQVILPADKFSFSENLPHEEKPFKTLYLLHGIFGNYTDWTANTRIQRWAEEKNLAVVMPSGDNSFYVDHPQSGSIYGSFIGEELVEITRKMFPLSRKREDTFIGGLSMGGYGAVRNGLKYYNTYSHIITLSGALHILETPDELHEGIIPSETFYFGNIREAAKSDKNPRILIQQLAHQMQTENSVHFPRIFQACGTEDHLLAVNRTYRSIFLENGIDLTYNEGTGGHDWDFWDTWIKKALDWLPLDESSAGVNSGNIRA